MDQFLLILSLVNSFGSNKGFFQRSGLTWSLFFDILIIIFNTAKSSLIYEKAIVFTYSKIVRSVFFSTGNYLIVIFPFQIHNTQPRILILEGYVIMLMYFTSCIQLRTFNLFRLNVILQEKKSAFALLHASIVRSLICEKAIVFMY